MDAAIDHPLEGVYVSLFAWRQVRWGTVLILVLFNSRPNSLVTAPLIGRHWAMYNGTCDWRTVYQWRR